MIRIGLFALPFVAITAGAAEPQLPKSALREACKADYQRLCANVPRGGGRIKQCMRDNRDKLSEPCRRALDQRTKDTPR
jgi:hypothetical protein